MEAPASTSPQLQTPTRSPAPPATLTLMDPSSTGSPALSVAITVLAVLLGLTGLGIYLAFGPPSKGLTDPFDDHDD
jgi:PsbN protein